jgi:hypothetical protein
MDGIWTLVHNIKMRLYKDPAVFCPYETLKYFPTARTKERRVEAVTDWMVSIWGEEIKVVHENDAKGIA